MSQSLNPYAPPLAELRTASDEHCWRDGPLVVLRAGHDFPPRCVCCNAPARPPRWARRFIWHSPWLYLLIVLNILIYIVVALLVRRSVKLHPALCTVHRTVRWRRRLTGLAVFIVGMGVLFTGTANTVPSLATLREAQFAAGVLVLLAGIAIAAREPAILAASRIDGREVRVRGAGERFLASLPAYTGLPEPAPAKGGGR